VTSYTEKALAREQRPQPREVGVFPLSRVHAEGVARLGAAACTWPQRPVALRRARGGGGGWLPTRRTVEDRVRDIPDGLVQFVHRVADLAVRRVIDR
jgi:hypothetical protein